MKKQGGLSVMAVLAVASLMAGCATDGATIPAQVEVDTSRFVFEKFGVVSLPRPGEAVPMYAEFTGVSALQPALRSWLQSRGYKLADSPGTGVATLQFAGDYLAEGRFQEAGSVRTGNVDLGKVLGMFTLPPNKDAPRVGAPLITEIGKDLGVNYNTLQMSGGSLAGSFGIQAVMAGLFDVTGLTSWIRRTHAPGARNGPIQIVNIWVNYTAGDGARSDSRIEASYTEPILAPTQLAGSAMDFALSSLDASPAKVGVKP